MSLPIADSSQPKQNEGFTRIILNVRKDGLVEVGKGVYPVSQVAAELRRVAAEKDIGLEKKVNIRADRDAHYGKVMRLMAACAEADLWNVSFGTYPENLGERPPKS